MDRSKKLARVILVSPLPPPYGGIARWTESILSIAPESLGANLSHINTAHRTQRTDETSISWRLLTGVIQLLRVVSKLAVKLIQHRGTQAVHLNSSGSIGLIRDVLVLTICRIFRIRGVLHLRFGRVPEVLDTPGMERSLLLVAVKLAGSTICIDQATYESLDAEKRVSGLVLIPNYIDVARYEPRFERHSKTVVFLGSVLKSKGVVELLQAWYHLKDCGWKLKFVGPISAEMSAELSKIADASVEFVGAVTHSEAMNNLYEAEILVLPSYTEGFPNVVLEAMATGTPVVATRVGAIPQMLGSGSGFLMEPKNPEKLREVLLNVINNRQLRLNAAIQARRKVETQFSMETVTEQYQEVWNT